MSACGANSASTRAGFVLAGGRSSRMGRDKALLEVGASPGARSASCTLIEHIAGEVRQAAGNVTLIASPDRYAHFGIPVVADRVEGCGPLGGLFTALSITGADWNLVVACDLPNATAALFEELFVAAEHAGCVALVPSTSSGLEPLCAVYHRTAKASAETAILHKQFRMQEFVSGIEACIWPAPAAGLFRNVNTPEDWCAQMDWRMQTEALKP